MTKFCAQCGAPREVGAKSCSVCGAWFSDGPDLLVIVGVFHNDKLLLIQRGVEPYAGKWGPPGGYVEHGEPVEAAAARELEEETGLVVPAKDFLITGVVSLTAMNQVHVVLMTLLGGPVTLNPRLPEARDAQWFSAEAFQSADVWNPYQSLDVDLFWPARAKRFRFVHQTDGERRVITTDVGLDHPWEDR